MKRGTRLLFRAVGALAILLVGGAGLVLRMSIEGADAMNQSDREFDQGHLREALTSAQRAASLYAPGLRHIQRADARLDAIASGAEASQRVDIAILAWQAIRSTEYQRVWGLVARPTVRARRAERRFAALVTGDGRQGSLVEQQQASHRVMVELGSGWRLHSVRRLLGAMALVLVAAGTAALYRGVVKRAHRFWIGIGVTVASVGAIAWAILLSLP